MAANTNEAPPSSDNPSSISSVTASKQPSQASAAVNSFTTISGAMTPTFEKGKISANLT